MEYVPKEVCEVIHEKASETRQGMNDHLDRLDQAVLALQQISKENQTLLKILMEERAMKAREAQVNVFGDGKRPILWQAPWFKYLVITGCVIVVLLTLGAVSDNVVAHYVDLMKVVPQ